MERFGSEPAAPPADMKEDLEQLSGDKSLPEQLRDPEVLSTPHPFIKKYAADIFKKEKSFYKQQRQTFFDNASKYMDHSFGVVENMLEQALRTKDLTAFWGLFWETVEGAVITFADKQDDKAASRCRGRGEFPVQMKLQKAPGCTETGDDYTTHSPAWLSAFRNHANRCKHAADCLAMLARGKVEPRKAADLELKTNQCIAKIIEFLVWQLENEEAVASPPLLLTSRAAATNAPPGSKILGKSSAGAGGFVEEAGSTTAGERRRAQGHFL